MAERFEDLVVWQKARALTRQIYNMTREPVFARDFGLATQIQRASVSVMSNIAEGFERNSSAEFHQYLSIAKASCAELRNQLYIALDIGYLEQSQFNQLMSQADEIRRLLIALRATTKPRQP
ncbi:MAG: four helix bundle protein [Anaerolineae bacterium]|nr:four helix bundle protein [Anaerolineae bacterium]